YQLGPRAHDKRAAIVAVMVKMTPTCFVTSLTTAVGFGSLVTATIPAIQSFGAYVAAAVMMAFAAQMLVTPIVLSLAPAPRSVRFTDPTRARTGRLLMAIARFGERRRGWVLMATLALSVPI